MSKRKISKRKLNPQLTEKEIAKIKEEKLIEILELNNFSELEISDLISTSKYIIRLKNKKSQKEEFIKLKDKYGKWAAIIIGAMSEFII
jgi:rRNA pseudouridine-1189 N-methylase Emg1 (Nep1/Mra1 family)